MRYVFYSFPGFLRQRIMEKMGNLIVFNGWVVINRLGRVFDQKFKAAKAENFAPKCEVWSEHIFFRIEEIRLTSWDWYSSYPFIYIYLKGFIPPRWLFGISAINSSEPVEIDLFSKPNAKFQLAFLDFIHQPVSHKVAPPCEAATRKHLNIS